MELMYRNIIVRWTPWEYVRSSPRYMQICGYQRTVQQLDEARNRFSGRTHRDCTKPLQYYSDYRLVYKCYVDLVETYNVK